MTQQFRWASRMILDKGEKGLDLVRGRAQLALVKIQVDCSLKH